MFQLPGKEARLCAQLGLVHNLCPGSYDFPMEEERHPTSNSQAPSRHGHTVTVILVGLFWGLPPCHPSDASCGTGAQVGDDADIAASSPGHAPTRSR